MEKNELMRKLYRLTRSTNEHEATNAQRMLDKLLEKSSMRLVDILNEPKKEFSVRYESTFEKRLLCQIVAMVGDRNIPIYSYKSKQRVLFFESTEPQHIEVKQLFEHYRVLLEKQLDAAYLAFLYANNIFPESPQQNPTKKDEDDEELHRAAIALISGSVKGTFSKKLEAPNAHD